MSILLELGFCPQFSALWNNATTAETLRLFAVLKGFSGDQVARRVDYFLRQMQIAQYRDVWAEKLSGGETPHMGCAHMSMVWQAHSARCPWPLQ